MKKVIYKLAVDGVVNVLCGVFGLSGGESFIVTCLLNVCGGIHQSLLSKVGLK